MITELRIFLISNFPEFECERLVIRNLVETNLKRYCLENYNCDLIFVDSHNDDSYPELKPNTTFMLGKVEEWNKSPQQPILLVKKNKITRSDIQFLTGEKLWNRKVFEFVSKIHYEAIHQAVEKLDTFESGRLQRSYHLDPVHQIYRLNMILNVIQN
ncbi:hypothetical protein MN116_006762 [Schistosoma mekongi]|uniref:Uncharacterized protein n=1 Tax=Schistosoma mekongi TaxID=38744 RepID=A0AAE1Z964_SCHME|nr:hypothetical protein MN116_006762 [Schistosoma mekongi]